MQLDNSALSHLKAVFEFLSGKDAAELKRDAVIAAILKWHGKTAIDMAMCDEIRQVIESCDEFTV